MAASGGSLAGFALKKFKFERNNSCFFSFLVKKETWVAFRYKSSFQLGSLRL
jgi:hypothetical protein